MLSAWTTDTHQKETRARDVLGGQWGTMLQQVHTKRLPRVEDLCLTKQKGFFSHMVVYRFVFFFLGLSFPVCKNQEMPAYQKGMVKVDIQHLSTNCLEFSEQCS